MVFVTTTPADNADAAALTTAIESSKRAHAAHRRWRSLADAPRPMHASAVDKLMKCDGIDLDATDACRHTPLLRAAAAGRTRCGCSRVPPLLDGRRSRDRCTRRQRRDMPALGEEGRQREGEKQHGRQCCSLPVSPASARSARTAVFVGAHVPRCRLTFRMCRVVWALGNRVLSSCSALQRAYTRSQYTKLLKSVIDGGASLGDDEHLRTPLHVAANAWYERRERRSERGRSHCRFLPLTQQLWCSRGVVVAFAACGPLAADAGPSECTRRERKAERTHAQR